MQNERLISILKELNRTSTDIEASGVISNDGLIMAAQLPNGMDEDRIGSMSAAMLSLGSRTTQELERGEFEQVLVKGKHGYILMAHTGEGAVVTVMTRPDAKLGLIFLDVKRAAENLSKVMTVVPRAKPRLGLIYLDTKRTAKNHSKIV